jgi:magnesium-transporting ATPase (P-type)
MSSGCSAAKDASDMIMLNNDFSASMKAVMWGRNIFANTRKFIQFQVTVNFTCLLITLGGAIMYSDPPINIVQLLWVNLIMDTFAAIALSSEPPQPSIIRGHPIRSNDKLMNPVMWRAIIGMTLFIVVMMTLLFVFGKWWFGFNNPVLCYETVSTEIIDDTTGLGTGVYEDITSEVTCADEEDGIYSYTTELGTSTADQVAKITMFTIYFNSFMMMNIFNFFNCRKIGPKEYNIFENIFDNWMFCVMVLMIFGIQYCICETWLSSFFTTHSLTSEQWGYSIALGLLTWPAAALIKMTPLTWVQKIPVNINEDELDENDKVMKAFNTGMKGSVSKKKAAVVNPDTDAPTHED